MDTNPLTTSVLIRICLATAGWALSFGVGTQAVSHWLTDRGQSDTTIGLVHSIYYLGVAGASLVVPALMRRLGMGCALAGMLLSATTLLAFPLVDSQAWWFVLRLLSGAACALSVIPLETHISRASDGAARTQNFSYYAVALTLGGAIGIGMGLTVYEAGDTSVFWLGAIPPLVSVAILRMGAPGDMVQHAEVTPSGSLRYRRNWLSFGTAWSQGFLEGGMLAFLALYLESRGLERDVVGILMGVTMIGVIAFQVPVAWLGDRLGRLPMLLVCYAAVLAGLAAVPLSTSLVAMGVWLFAFGAFSGAMYPLGLSLLGDRTAEANLSRAYAVYLAMECVGSQLGAAAMGRARDTWGQGSMFWVGFAAVAAVLVSWLVVRRFERDAAAKPAEESMKRAA